MDAQTIATLLLVMRLIAVVLLVAVIIKQIKNLRTLHTDYPAVRITVLVLTAVLLVGQFIPILLDAIVSFGGTYAGRRTPAVLGVAYALSNATKDVVIGALLAFLHYRPNVRSKKR